MMISSSLRKTFIAAISLISFSFADVSANVVLGDFGAFADFKRNQVQLKWNTLSEQDNWAFTVQRSSDGEQYRNIGTVNGQGNSDRPRSYRFIDEAPPKSGSYYRIEWQSDHGTEHSMPSFVTFGGELPNGNGTQTRSIASGSDRTDVKDNSARGISMVDLVDFRVRGIASRGVVYLKWMTLMERHNAGFSVQRSLDSDVWTDIGFVPGELVSNESIDYQFEDQNAPRSKVYYRIQYDHNGMTVHTAPQMVNLGDASTGRGQAAAIRSSENMKVYQTFPNPADRTTRIMSVSDFKAIGKLSAIAADGKRYKVNAKPMGNEVELDLTELPEGIYVIQLEDGFARVQKK